MARTVSSGGWRLTIFVRGVVHSRKVSPAQGTQRGPSIPGLFLTGVYLRDRTRGCSSTERPEGALLRKYQLSP